jgi:hypothetical protein
MKYETYIFQLDYYKALGLNSTATFEELKASYIQLGWFDYLTLNFFNKINYLMRFLQP